MSGSGKSTLAEYLAHQSKRDKFIFAPCGGFGGIARAAVYYDDSEFLRDIWNRSDADLFVDEADIIFNRANGAAVNWIMQRGRHYNLSVTLISQRPTLINTTARYQCGEAFVFRGNKSDYDCLLPIYGLDGTKINIPLYQFIKLNAVTQSLSLYQLRIDDGKTKKRH